MKRQKPSGAQFRKKRKEEDEKRERHRDALLKYLPSTSANPEPTTTAPPPSTSAPSDAASSASPSHTQTASEATSPPSPIPSASMQPGSEATSPPVPSTTTQHTDVKAPPMDPADWPSDLTDQIRTEFVLRGAYRIKNTFIFPKHKGGRGCRHDYFNRVLVNGEKIQRSWLMYSKKNDSLHCFCCRLFSVEESLLNREGLKDWKNATSILEAHENSREHKTNLVTWKVLGVRLAEGLTTDKQETERKRWREVLTRLVAIIQSLAERNMALRGSTAKLNERDNGNFLKLVELMSKFDPVMMQHVRRVESDANNHAHYLGNRIQNELMDCISAKILEHIVEEIKTCKYYSIILDCTPDLIHEEHFSLIVRFVTRDDKPQIKEHFLGFLGAEESTGESLSTLILKRLEELNIPFEDCRGQSYDNGANMKEKNEGVQARLLQKNPRAFHIPCGAHTLNLVVANAAKSSADAAGYFGYLSKLFTLFSASTHRWNILLKHVKITLKSCSETRWQSRIESVEAVRYQAGQVRDALVEVREITADPAVMVEAQSLAEEIGSYRFCICTVVWHAVLSKIQRASELLRSPSMQPDVAVRLLEKTRDSLAGYRNTGFPDAQTAAEEMCEGMNVDAALKEKRLRKTKRCFSYESPDEPVGDSLRKMETAFFNVAVDATLSSLDERCQSLGELRDKFGVLLNFPKMAKEELLEHCQTLSTALTHDGRQDIDATELAVEMERFPQLPSTNMTNMELLTFLHERKLTVIYPNMWVALRVSTTQAVTVAAAESSFSKLKQIKTYLGSTMGQERLSGLAIISINREVSKQLSYDDAIDTICSKI